MIYTAHNYAMGRSVEKATVEAANDQAAIRKAERLFKAGHASTQGGRKGFVIGLKVTG